MPTLCLQSFISSSLQSMLCNCSKPPFPTIRNKQHVPGTISFVNRGWCIPLFSTRTLWAVKLSNWILENNLTASWPQMMVQEICSETGSTNWPDPFRIYIYNHNYRVIHLTSFNTHSPHKCGKYITMPHSWNPQPWCLPPRAPKTAPQWMPRARPPIGVAAVCGRRRSWTCRPRRSKSSLEARRGQDDPSTNISNIGVMWLTMLNPVHGGFTWSIISHQRKNQSSDLIWGGKICGKTF